MAFPSNPSDGQTYSANGTTYIYNAGLGVWDVQGASTAASGVTSVAGRTGAVTLTAADISGGTFASGALTTNGNLFVSGGNLYASSGTSSTSTTTGALVVTGGVGISGAVYIGGATTITGATALNGGLTTTTISASSTITAVSLSIGGGIQNTPVGNSSASTGAFTTLTASSATVSGSVQINSIGIGTAASGTAGEIRATAAITAYYSDGRLKTNVKRIENALAKVRRMSGVYYTGNEVAAKYGYNTTEQQVGFITQEWESEMPEIVKPAPFDIGQREDGTEYSLSGENYQTMQYERAGPLLLEAIKDLADELDLIKKHLGM